MITSTLAYFPSPSQGVWHSGPFPVRAYALFIIVGIIAALVIGDRRWAARGGERGVIYDIALWAVPFGLLGGRLYHVITDWQTYFGAGGAGPAAALRIWDGGLGIWGAVALGGVGAWIGCRRRGIPLPAFGDAIAPGIVLAQAIGRIGNYFNQELYGRETTVPWGMEVFYRRDPSGIIDVHSLNGVSTGQVAAVVHPTFLYELLWNLLVFAVLLYIDRRFKIGHGRLFALYVAGYCVGRFCVELLRDDFATHVAGIRINSFTATFVFIGAIVYFILAPKGREDPATLRGDADEETLFEELADDLAAVAATTGVVAAATVAAREDADESPEAQAEPAAVAELDVEAVEEPVVESEPAEVVDEATPEAADEEPEVESAEVLEEATPEAEPAEVLEEATPQAEPAEVAELDVEAVGEPEPEPVVAGVAEEDTSGVQTPTDADDLEEFEDESILEAEVAAPGVETESGVEAEDADLIDEDHDPVDEEDLESLDEPVAVHADGPLSEQGEEVHEADEPAVDAEVEVKAADEHDAEVAIDEVETPDPEVAVEAEALDEPAPGRRRWWRRS